MKKILIVLLVLLISSCGSRKRSLDKKEEKKEISIKKNIELEVKNNIKKVDTSAVVEIKNIKEEKNSFNGEIADTSKPATITEEIKNGKKKVTYTNFKNVNSSSGKKSNNSIKKENTKHSNTDLSKIDLKQKDEFQEKKDSSSKEVKVDRKSGYSWIMWLIISLALVGYGYFSIKKKQYNPLDWFK
jgi:hypothetical protein